MHVAAAEGISHFLPLTGALLPAPGTAIFSPSSSWHND
jgi:hypothetical protein